MAELRAEVAPGRAWLSGLVAPFLRDREALRRESSGDDPGPRPAGGLEDELAAPLAEKVLHGWLQNRHQVLVPLSFRLGRLSVEDRDVLIRFAAAVLLNASPADPPARRGVETWLGANGAGPEASAALTAALAAPEPLHQLITAVRAVASRERGFEAFAYAVAVAAADMRRPAGRLFADYVAARLDLPADTIRSVDRRVRR